jgi:hypothetical protein
MRDRESRIVFYAHTGQPFQTLIELVLGYRKQGEIQRLKLLRTTPLINSQPTRRVLNLCII